ncbi:hypothetical protein PG993_002380 [Apiospora rasikravindrae]|uniref:Uncharacterized protein n=1 Tax=Apiospora rasikravindrae TaxID=990691 RepID=A0ABR1TWG2_9PEZI
MAALTEVQLKLRDTEEEIQRVEAQINKDEAKQEELQDLRAEFVEEGVIAVLQNRANNASQRIGRSRSRLDHLEKERKRLQLCVSLQPRGPEADVANQPADNGKRAAPDDLAQAPAKRFCDYQGASQMDPAEMFHESLPSDEIRKVVEEGLERGDQVERYVLQAACVRFVSPLIKNGTLIRGRDIVLDDFAELQILDLDRAKILTDCRWNRPSVRQEHKNTLDDVVGLLLNREVKSISHIPSQMSVLATKECRTTNAQHIVDMLLNCVRNLQLDSTVIGQQTMAIADGVKPTDGTNNLLMALQSTHSWRDMKEIYEVQVQDEGHNGSASGSEEIWRGVCSADSTSYKLMLLRLFRSALVLSKYTCLATCLTLAVVPKFGGSLDGIEALKNATLLCLIQHHRDLLAAFHDFCEANSGSVAVDMPDFAARYDPDNEVRNTLRKEVLWKRIVELSRINGINVFWHEFLASKETEMTF